MSAGQEPGCSIHVAKNIGSDLWEGLGSHLWDHHKVIKSLHMVLTQTAESIPASSRPGLTSSL